MSRNYVYFCPDCHLREAESSEPSVERLCPNCGKTMICEGEAGDDWAETKEPFSFNDRDDLFGEDRKEALKTLESAINAVDTYYRYWNNGYKYIGETLNNMRQLLHIIQMDECRGRRKE